MIEGEFDVTTSRRSPPLQSLLSGSLFALMRLEYRIGLHMYAHTTIDLKTPSAVVYSNEQHRLLARYIYIPGTQRNITNYTLLKESSIPISLSPTLTV